MISYMMVEKEIRQGAFIGFKLTLVFRFVLSNYYYYYYLIVQIKRRASGRCEAAPRWPRCGGEWGKARPKPRGNNNNNNNHF